MAGRVAAANCGQGVCGAVEAAERLRTHATPRTRPRRMTNTARSRFAAESFSWWDLSGAAFDDRQARARRATAHPGTLFRSLGVSPVPEALSGSACHAGGFFECVASDLVSADSPAAGEPAVHSAKPIFLADDGSRYHGSQSQCSRVETGRTHSQSFAIRARAHRRSARTAPV